MDDQRNVVQRTRRLPRSFSLHWGSGEITEEASADGEYHEPCFQLLEYAADGPAAGSFSIRFCYYSHDGRFQRSPLIVGEEDIDGLRESLKRTPKLRAILQRLLE